MSATFNDFKELKIFGKRKPKKKKFFNQYKEQKEMINAFVNGLLTDGKSPISFEEIVAVTKASFKVIESVKYGGQQVEG